MQAKFMFAVLIAAAIFPGGCKKESPDNIQCDTTGWIPDSIRYSNTVAPMLAAYCTSCHNDNQQSGSVDLNDYPNVKKYVDNDQLLGTMGHLKHYKPMPENGAKLPQDKICEVKFWIDNGALNN